MTIAQQKLAFEVPLNIFEKSCQVAMRVWRGGVPGCVSSHSLLVGGFRGCALMYAAAMQSLVPSHAPLAWAMISNGQSCAEALQSPFLWAQTRKSRMTFRSCGLPQEFLCLVPRRGLEPPRSYPLVPETSASTNSATWANSFFKKSGMSHAASCLSSFSSLCSAKNATIASKSRA
jgi:hypothetical protein